MLFALSRFPLVVPEHDLVIKSWMDLLLKFINAD